MKQLLVVYLQSKEIFKIIIMRQTDELSDFREFNDQNINNKDENGQWSYSKTL